MATLLKMDKEVESDEFITNAIRMHDMMLQSWVKNFKDANYKDTVDITDTDLSLD
jgi:hypothetical protein